MSDDILKKADGFRLSVDPTPDDVNEANWIIDRLSARVVDREARYRLVVGDKIDLRAKLATVETQRDELLEALGRLCNEVSGMEAFEAELRDVMSNTNWNVIMLRRNEASAAIAKAKDKT